MTTTEIAAPELQARVIALLNASPANVRAQFESKLAQAQAGTLSRLYALHVIRHVADMGGDDLHVTEQPRPGNPTGQSASNPRSNDASDAQRNYAMDLLRTRVVPDERVPGSVKTAAEVIALVAACDRMAKDMARNIIDAFKDRPRIQVPQPRAAVVAKAAPVELEDGIYRLGDDWFKVVHAIHGSGRQYAKRLVVHGPGSAEFQYDGGAIRKLTPDHKVSLEEAKQFGHVYGVCCCCGATLTDEKSIEAGIGPVCAKKF